MSSKKQLTRRDFLKIIAIGSVTGLTTKLGLDSLSKENVISETRLLMGTVVNLKVVHDDPAAASVAVRACLDQMENLEQILSRFIPASQLSQLNRAGQLRAAHPALLALVAESQKISRLSGGAFDISINPILQAAQAGRIPTDAEHAAVGYQNIVVNASEIAFLHQEMSVTLDGIAKGYIVDRGVEVLQAHGLTNIMVEAGGDLVALGRRVDGDAWKVGVAHPRPTGDSGFLTSFSVSNQAVATSGDYVQYYQGDKNQHHIIDPHTQASPPELASVTVLAPNAMLADALSTTVMVAGIENGLQLVNAYPEVEALVIDKDLQVFKSSNFPRN